MTVDLLGKALPFFGRIHRMEAAPVKHEAKWRSVNVGLKDVEHCECTRHVRFGNFLPSLLYRNLGNINTDHVEVLLREPDSVVASAASDLQCVTGSYRCRGYDLDKVEVGLADIPRSGAFFILFIETIFGRHGRFSPLLPLPLRSHFSFTIVTLWTSRPDDRSDRHTTTHLLGSGVGL